MIPILYGRHEEKFKSNGIGRLPDCISCKVTEERNGIFECEFQYPVNGRRYKGIEEGCIISVTHDDTQVRQPFIIYRRSAPIDGVVTFNAHHISYQLGHVVLGPFTAGSVADAFEKFRSQAITTNRFEFWTDKATQGTFKIEVPTPCKKMLGGVEGSILDVYGGGEYKWDGYTVRLYQSRGVERDTAIRYGKNIISLTQTLDESGTYTTVVPYWSDGTDLVIGDQISIGAVQYTEPMTDENDAYIEYAPHDPFTLTAFAIKAVPLDMSQRWQIKPTKAQVEEAARSYLNSNKPWIPGDSIKVDFVALWQTDEYEEYAALERVNLCDTVPIIHPELGITTSAKVVKTVYDVLEDRYEELELGTASTSLSETITARIEDQLRGVPSIDYMEAAIENATAIMTGAHGGYKVTIFDADGRPVEDLYMDTDDPATAVNILRINQYGIAFSTNGINGPYKSAWLISGQFNADFITAGTLNANMIRAGRIQDVLGNSYWDLTSGEMALKGNLSILKSGLLFEYNDITWHEWDGVSGSMIERVLPGLRMSMTDGVSDTQWGIAREVLSRSGLVRSSLKNVRKIYYELKRVGDTYIQPQYYTDIFETSLLDGTDVHHISFGYTDFYDVQVSSLGATGGTSGIRVGILNQTPFFGAGSVFSTRLDNYKQACSFVIYGTHGYINGREVAIDSTSSRRYKKYIAEIHAKELDPHRLLDLPVRQYQYKVDAPLQYDDMEGKTLPGFIAEEVEEIYPAAAIHKEGQVESWDERRIVPGMLALIQEQQKTIESLTKRLEEMEAKLADL